MGCSSTEQQDYSSREYAQACAWYAEHKGDTCDGSSSSASASGSVAASGSSSSPSSSSSESTESQDRSAAMSLKPLSLISAGLIAAGGYVMI